VADPEGRISRALSEMVGQEAHRILSESQIAPDPARVAAGWERRFIADGFRADEMVALYEELGFEVVADPVKPEQLVDDCQDCRLLILLEFKTIYTRRKTDKGTG
jgi:hypothetical protein